MANRNFQNNLYHMERSVVKLFAEVAIGATGAPTLIGYKNGIASVSRTVAGEYLVTLEDSYFELLGLGVMLEAAAGEDLVFQLKEESVKVGKTFSFFCLAAGVLTDPSDGSKLRLEITLKNSSMGA